MPTSKELSEAKKASVMISSSLELLNDSTLELQPLKEQNESVKQFITENADHFNDLSQEQLEPFRQTLTTLVDGLQKVPAQFENSKDQFDSVAVENIKQFTTPLSYLGESINPKRSKEDIADSIAKENIDNSLSSFDEKIADFSQTRGLSQNQKGTVKDIKNRLTTLKTKLSQYFGEGEEKVELTDEKKEELSTSVNELSDRMEKLGKESKIAQRLHKPDIFDTKFLHDISENLAKIIPSINGKKITLEEITEKASDKVAEAENITSELNEEVKQDVKEDIKENVKEDVKENVKEDVKEEIKENIKEDVKEKIKEDIKEDVKQEAVESVKKEESKEVNKEETKTEKTSTTPNIKVAPQERTNSKVDYASLVEMYNQIDNADSAFIRSSPEFRQAKSALKGAIKIYEDSLDPKDREGSLKKIEEEGLSPEKQRLVNQKLREALDNTDLYIEKKGNERNASDRAVDRYNTMTEISGSLREQVENSDREVGRKTLTNAEAADKLIEAARKKYNPDLSKEEKARILATLQFADELKKNGDDRFNITGAKKFIDERSKEIEKTGNFKNKDLTVKERAQIKAQKPQVPQQRQTSPTL